MRQYRKYREDRLMKFFREVSRMSPSDVKKLMIFPFWFFVIVILQMFHPMFEDKNYNVFFLYAATIVLFILTMWIVEGIQGIFRPEPVHYPNLPYNLFHHYRLKNMTRNQVVYLVRRLADGVYKIGQATNFDNRLKGLQREYGPIAIVAVWEVDSCSACERIALDRTKEFAYQETGHQELRVMNDWQCWQFITEFTKYVVELDASEPEAVREYQTQMFVAEAIDSES